MQHTSKSLHKGKIHVTSKHMSHINTKNISWESAHVGRAHVNTHNIIFSFSSAFVH
jgi:hypothetical protein